LSLYGTLAVYEEQASGRVWSRLDSEEPEDVTDLLICDQFEISEQERAGIPEDMVRDYRSGFSKVHARDRLPKEFRGLINGHEGSHQFLVDDFVRACVTMRLPPNHVWQAARFNVPGIIAHESALRDGESMAVPDFGDAPEW
jgi:hypothetical protein